MADTLEWSPHPLRRPGFLLAGLLHLMVGLALVLDAFFVPTVLDRSILGPVVAFGVSLVVALSTFVPRGDRRSAGRVAVALIVVLAGLALQIGMSTARGPFHPGLAFGPMLALVGLLLVAVSETRRRRIRIHLDEKVLVVFARPYRLEHSLPLENVRDVSAARTLGGRLFGYADFVARVRKGTMQDRITKPLVAEEPPEHALGGNGWDEEEHYHLVAAHPYKKVRRELENRILLAKMPPKEREEARLADRLAEDLGDVRV